MACYGGYKNHGHNTNAACNVKVSGPDGKLEWNSRAATLGQPLGRQIGCAIMLALAETLPNTGIVELGNLIVFICPRLHLSMPVGVLGGKHKGCCHNAADTTKSNGQDPKF